MYVDKLYNLSKKDLKIMSKNAIISIDFCLNQHSEEEIKRIFSLLDYVDYIFISEAEAKSLTNLTKEKEMSLVLGKLCKGICILHTPRASYTSNGESAYIHKTNFIKDKKLNVLGAGDVFAASFIKKCLENNHDNLEKIIEFSHQNTTKFLLKKGNQNEKI